MAQIGTIRLQTQNNGTVSVPVFNTGDSGSSVYEFVRVQTAGGTGFIPVVDPADASFPYLRVQSQNQGVVAVHNESSLFTQPVAASSLSIWYPFDSSAYDYISSETDDATDGQSWAGDSTAYDGSNNGSTYSSNGGVTDINAGADSGYYNIEGSNGDYIDTPYETNMSSSWSVSMWARFPDNDVSVLNDGRKGDNDKWGMEVNSGDLEFFTGTGGSFTVVAQELSISNTGWHHIVGTFDGNDYWKLYWDSSLSGDATQSPYNNGNGITIGEGSSETTYGTKDVDDFRFYTKELSGTEVSNIYSNTSP